MKYSSPIQSVVTISGPGEVRQHVSTSVGLADLSPLPRIGVLGRSLGHWLSANGYGVDPPLNRASRQQDGVVLLRLAANELIALPPIAAVERKEFIDANDGHVCFTVDRRASHCWFALVGSGSRFVLSKLCAHDLSAANVPADQVVQTSVAAIGAVLARIDCGGVPVFHLLADQSYGHYLWSCVVDAATEFNGRVFGVDLFRELDAGG